MCFWCLTYSTQTIILVIRNTKNSIKRDKKDVNLMQTQLQRKNNVKKHVNCTISKSFVFLLDFFAIFVLTEMFL